MSRVTRKIPNRNRPEPLHKDPGLQPERTTLAWARTVLAFITAAAICLRWIPQHGPFVLTLFTLATITGLAIQMTQHKRYGRGSIGIAADGVAADVPAVLLLTTAVVALSLLGLYVVLILA